MEWRNPLIEHYDSELLKKLRKAKYSSVEVLFQEAKVPRNTAYKIERGEAVQERSLRRYCSALGVPYEDVLFTLETPRHNPPITFGPVSSVNIRPSKDPRDLDDGQVWYEVDRFPIYFVISRVSFQLTQPSETVSVSEWRLGCQGIPGFPKQGIPAHSWVSLDHTNNSITNKSGYWQGIVRPSWASGSTVTEVTLNKDRPTFTHEMGFLAKDNGKDKTLTYEDFFDILSDGKIRNPLTFELSAAYRTGDGRRKEISKIIDLDSVVLEKKSSDLWVRKGRPPYHMQLPPM